MKTALEALKNRLQIVNRNQECTESKLYCGLHFILCSGAKESKHSIKVVRAKKRSETVEQSRELTANGCDIWLSGFLQGRLAQ